jgi:hypothetical protein
MKLSDLPSKKKGPSNKSNSRIKPILYLYNGRGIFQIKIDDGWGN